VLLGGLQLNSPPTPQLSAVAICGRARYGHGDGVGGVTEVECLVTPVFVVFCGMRNAANGYIVENTSGLWPLDLAPRYARSSPARWSSSSALRASPTASDVKSHNMYFCLFCSVFPGMSSVFSNTYTCHSLVSWWNVLDGFPLAPTPPYHNSIIPFILAFFWVQTLRYLRRLAPNRLLSDCWLPTVIGSPGDVSGTTGA